MHTSFLAFTNFSEIFQVPFLKTRIQLILYILKLLLNAIYKKMSKTGITSLPVLIGINILSLREPKLGLEKICQKIDIPESYASACRTTSV